LLTKISAPQFQSSWDLTEWFGMVFPRGIEVRLDRVPCPTKLTLTGIPPVWQQVLPFAQSLHME